MAFPLASNLASDRAFAKGVVAGKKKPRIA
jgi:hypothetical protein